MGFWMSVNCNFWCFIHANVVASSSVNVRFGDQISRVLDGPAVRTLCSCWNHNNWWSPLHVAKCTRHRMVSNWISAVVFLREDVLVTSSYSVPYVILSTIEWPRPFLMSIEVGFPLRCFMQTEEVAAAAAYVVVRSCRVSFNDNNSSITSAACLWASRVSPRH